MCTINIIVIIVTIFIHVYMQPADCHHLAPEAQEAAHGDNPSEETPNSEPESNGFLNGEGGFPHCAVECLSAACSKLSHKTS